MSCPNDILQLTTTVESSGNYSAVGFLSLNTNSLTGGNHYLQLYSGDTVGKSYDTINSFYGTILSANDFTFSNFLNIPINGNEPLQKTRQPAKN